MYTSEDSEAEWWLDTGGPQLEEGIDYDPMHFEWVHWLVMLHGYYPVTENSNNGN
jgi:hypothetical protein